MKERPILFSAPMVRALLEGRKTQTRRIVKLPNFDPFEYDGAFAWSPPGHPKTQSALYTWGAIVDPKIPPCPHGAPGDRLWVKETFRVNGTMAGPRITYRADEAERFPKGCPDNCMDWIADDNHWRPSIFMRRYASRIQLGITGVRIEKLNVITEKDAEAEGVAFMREIPDADETLTARQLYEILWESINGEGSWKANPWVWVIEFKRL